MVIAKPKSVGLLLSRQVHRKARRKTAKPQATDRIIAAPTSVQNHFPSVALVQCFVEMALVVKVLAWRPTLPEIAEVNGKKAISKV